MRKSTLILLLGSFAVVYFTFNLFDLYPSTQWGLFYRNRIAFENLTSLSICPFTVFKIDSSLVVLLPLRNFPRVSSFDACFRDEKSKFALVIPTKLYAKVIDSISIDSLFAMVLILKKFDWLWTVGGDALVTNKERPACTMIKNQWTLELSEDYSQFAIDSKSIVLEMDRFSKPNIECHPCDLLPDVFLIDLSKIDKINLTALVDLGESARVPLFLQLKNRSAYCPDLGISPNATEPIACNNLRSTWDGNFILLPPFADIFRLVFHEASGDSIEYWLGCAWSKLAYESTTPLHCSNWVRQFTFDIVDVLEKIKIEYRLIYGSLLGAVRSKDVIPWTVDGDISIEATWTFTDQVWTKLDEISGYKYSHADRLGDLHYLGLIRAFPMCPVRLSSLGNESAWNDLNRTEAIERAIRASQKIDATFSHGNKKNFDWRATGYVDLYWASEVESCTRISMRNSEFAYVEIAGRQFKTVLKPVENLKCLYGKNTWNESPPALSKDWIGYSD